MQVVMSGSVVTFTSVCSGSLSPIILTTGNPEASRLRDVLSSMRPKDGLHDHLCDSNPGDPDQWIDERGDPPITGLYAVEWVPGVGLISSDTPSPSEPGYVGWCCSQSRLRQEIDAALKT